MNTRKAVRTGLIATVVVVIVAAVSIASYRSGYQRGQGDVRQAVQKEAWEGAAYEKLAGDLGLSLRALVAIARNPEAFTPAERQFWREQAQFSVKALEQGLFPKLEQGQSVIAYGAPMEVASIRQMVERVKGLLAKMPA